MTGARTARFKYLPGVRTLGVALVLSMWYDETNFLHLAELKAVTRPREPQPVQVIFYTKAGCHLCEEARDMLDDIAALTSYDLTEIDIRSNPNIFEQYRYRIPVIIINNETTVEGRIEYRDLAKAFHLR